MSAEAAPGRWSRMQAGHCSDWAGTPGPGKPGPCRGRWHGGCRGRCGHRRRRGGAAPDTDSVAGARARRGAAARWWHRCSLRLPHGRPVTRTRRLLPGRRRSAPTQRCPGAFAERRHTRTSGAAFCIAELKSSSVSPNEAVDRQLLAVANTIYPVAPALTVSTGVRKAGPGWQQVFED